MNCWSHTLHAVPRELARQVICVLQRNSTIDATHDKDWHILHLNCIHLRHAPTKTVFKTPRTTLLQLCMLF